MLDRPGVVIVPGVFDVLSAMVAVDAGFDALYVSSYGASLSLLGLPDIGFVTRTQMVDLVTRIAARCDVPLIVDAEGGFGNPIHVEQTVRELERAGAAAVQIEDHDFGKHLTRSPRVFPIEESVDKVRAAVDARSTDSLLVIARTDSYGLHGLGEVVERATAFAEAGADLLFLPGVPLDDTAEIAAATGKPIVSVDVPGVPGPEMAAHGVRLAVFFAAAQLGAFQGMRAVLMELAASGSLPERLPSWPQLDAFVGSRSYKDDAGSYGLLGERNARD